MGIVWRRLLRRIVWSRLRIGIVWGRFLRRFVWGRFLKRWIIRIEVFMTLLWWIIRNGCHISMRRWIKFRMSVITIRWLLIVNRRRSVVAVLFIISTWSVGRCFIFCRFVVNWRLSRRYIASCWFVWVVLFSYWRPVVVVDCIFSIICCISVYVTLHWLRSYYILNITSIGRNSHSRNSNSRVFWRWSAYYWPFLMLVFKATLCENIWHIKPSICRSWCMISVSVLVIFSLQVMIMMRSKSNM